MQHIEKPTEDIESPAEDTGEKELRYPHEDVDSLARLDSAAQWREGLKLLAQQFPKVVGDIIKRTPPNLQQERSGRFVNGEEVTEQLANKHVFAELINEMGYNAPRSVVIDQNSSPEDIISRVKEELPGEPSFFVKPLDGVAGRGISQHDELSGVAESINGKSNEYLVQSDETPEEDWRYVLHQDADDPKKIWRIAYKKVRPVVVGDGHSTLSELINQSDYIPEDRRKRVNKKLKDGLLKRLRFNDDLKNDNRQELVPAEGEVTQVSLTGNISQGAVGQIPTEEELTKMDAFMEQFTSDLQEKIGSEINTMCFDIGVRDVAAFRESESSEEASDSIVFYEFQVPFGISGYFDEIYKIEGSLPEKAKAYYERQKMLYKLGRAVLAKLVKKEKAGQEN